MRATRRPGRALLSLWPLCRAAALAAAVLAGPASGAEVRRDGPFEALDLPSNTGAWYAVESELRPSPASGADPEGLLWTVRVDHFGGEEGHLIGWPRVGCELLAALRDWTPWERFAVRIRVSGRGRPSPRQPLGLGIAAPDRSRTHMVRPVVTSAGEWVEISIPLERLADPSNVRRVQFHI